MLLRHNIFNILMTVNKIFNALTKIKLKFNKILFQLKQ